MTWSLSRIAAAAVIASTPISVPANAKSSLTPPVVVGQAGPKHFECEVNAPRGFETIYGQTIRIVGTEGTTDGTVNFTGTDGRTSRDLRLSQLPNDYLDAALQLIQDCGQALLLQQTQPFKPGVAQTVDGVTYTLKQ